MLDKVFLDDFDDFVAASAHPRERTKHACGLFKSKVSVQTLIYKFVFDQLPEFVVLQVHVCGAFDCFLEGWHCLAVQAFQLIFNHWQNNIPELWSLVESILSDEVEAVHNMLISHVLSITLKHVHHIVGVLGSLKGEVNLVVPEGVVIVVVGVATRVDHHLRNWQ